MTQSSSASIGAPGDEIGGDVLPTLARAAIIEHLGGRPPKDVPTEAEGYLAGEAGVYVTLRDKKSGDLRGCLGSIEPECANVFEETRRSAVLAASEDERYKPVKDRRDLNRLSIEVCVIGKPERVDSIIELDPEIYGVVLTATKRGVRGVMLPNVPDLNTVDKQLAAIRREAGLRPDERLRIERFRVERFPDEDAE